MESADTIPGEETIERLCRVFADKNVGMAGGHPIPKNTKNSLADYASNLIWRLHHQIALKHPKCGELIAFRKVFDRIPMDVAVDEAWIEYEISGLGELYEIASVEKLREKLKKKYGDGIVFLASNKNHSG